MGIIIDIWNVVSVVVKSFMMTLKSVHNKQKQWDRLFERQTKFKRKL